MVKEYIQIIIVPKILIHDFDHYPDFSVLYETDSEFRCNFDKLIIEPLKEYGFNTDIKNIFTDFSGKKSRDDAVYILNELLSNDWINDNIGVENMHINLISNPTRLNQSLN